MPPSPWRNRNLSPCGSDAAYQRHRYRGEPVDQACREGHARYMTNRRADLRAAGWRWSSAANRYVPPEPAMPP